MKVEDAAWITVRQKDRVHSSFSTEQQMKSFSPLTILYLAVINLAGMAVLISSIGELNVPSPWLLAVLCLLASVALILKVEGPTSQSHYSFEFVVYGFTFATLGLSAAILVIFVSHVMEWIWNTPPWPIQLFSVMAYLVAAQVAGLVDLWIVQSGFFATGGEVAGTLFGMAVFVVLIHLMTWMFHRLGRGEASGNHGYSIPSRSFWMFPCSILAPAFPSSGSPIHWHWPCL